MSERTPGPWELRRVNQGRPSWCGRPGDRTDRRNATAIIFLCHSVALNNEANAAFICLAVNSHEHLVAALKGIAHADAIDLALDPDWARRIAGAALKAAGVDPT